jgi:hypothetical protein
MSEPRRTRPGISIDATSRWWSGAGQIVNASVLAYFKSRLRRDRNRDYYIDNRFGELREHGYLDRVEGFPLAIETIFPAVSDAGQLELEIRLDCGESLRVSATSLTVYDDQTLGIILPERGVPARLGPMAMASLVDCLVEIDSGGGYRLEISGSPPIDLPRGDFVDIFSPANSEYT